MKANLFAMLLFLFISGCASPPEQQAANDQKRASEQKTEQEKRQTEQAQKLRQEQDRLIQKYAAFNDRPTAGKISDA